jgi:molybdopterin synthase sulfur carrier subunit
MVIVEFLGPIEKSPLKLEIKNLKELKEELNKMEELKEWLENSAVAVNDKLVSSLDVELKDGDKISVLPPVCGG